MVQMRKVVRELYPDHFGENGKPAEAPKRRLLSLFTDRRARRNGARPARMSKKRLACTVVALVLAGYLLTTIYYYNTFVQLQSDVNAAKSHVNVQLQRRKDIVASLNTVVVAYAKHEKAIFERAVDTRKEIMQPTPGGAEKETKNAGGRLSIPGIMATPEISRLLAVAEGFPALRLSENFQRLMDALVESETKIAEQRILLNGRCNAMSTALATYPGRVFNMMLRFEVPQFYEADSDVRDPVKLDLNPQ